MCRCASPESAPDVGRRTSDLKPDAGSIGARFTDQSPSSEVLKHIYLSQIDLRHFYKIDRIRNSHYVKQQFCSNRTSALLCYLRRNRGATSFGTQPDSTDVVGSVEAGEKISGIRPSRRSLYSAALNAARRFEVSDSIRVF